MKKIILAFALLTAPYISVCSTENNNRVPVLSWSEYFYLNNFYAASYEDPYFIVKKTNLELDYYLILLEKHIKVIEHRIQSKETAWHSTEIKIGLGLVSALSIGLGGAVLHPLIRQIYTGTYNKAEIPVAMLASLASFKFTRAERKKLDNVTVDKLIFVYKNSNEKNIYSYIMNTLTDIDAKKINYLARRLAVEKAQIDIFTVGGSGLLITALMAFQPIYNALHYSEYLEEQLRKDQLLYDLLYEEKIKRI